MVDGGQAAGLGTLLAVMQILDQTLSRMRYSTQGRMLAELALVRISQLEDLDELAEVIAQLRSGAGLAAPRARRRRPGVGQPSRGCRHRRRTTGVKKKRLSLGRISRRAVTSNTESACGPVAPDGGKCGGGLGPGHRRV